MRIKIEEIKQMCMDVLVKLGLSQDEASVVVEEYLYGELTGKKSHGFASFVQFAAEKAKTRKGLWKTVEEDDSFALIDGNGNLGQLVGKFAMNLTIEKAKKKGIALVGMYNMQSYLMPGYYARMASEQGMVGVVMNNSAPAVAPYGGRDPKLGTNPIAIALPTKDVPFVFDGATATRAKAEVRLAQKLGHPMPEGMAMDEEGNPTTDPEKFHALTAVGGYKGYGLCLAIEILAGAFVRAKMGSKIKDSTDRGFLFLAINPEIFVPLDAFKEETSELIKEVKSSRKVEGTDEILIPGERAAKAMKENKKKEYLEIDDKIVEDIKKML